MPASAEPGSADEELGHRVSIAFDAEAHLTAPAVVAEERLRGANGKV
jgi:hypothetical protein